MSIKAYIVILVLLLGALAALIWKDVKKKSAIAEATAAVYSPSALAKKESGTLVEQDWLVDEVVRDLAEMIGFAAEGKAFDASTVQVSVVPVTGDQLAYDVTITGPRGEVKQSLKLQHHLWSPINYQSLAKALLDAWKVPGATSNEQAHAKLSEVLHKPDTGTIIKENKRISEALNQQPADPASHQAAALLIGTLAFREAAGPFSDTRPALGRMTAHLALAQALKPTPSTCGQLAAALQLTLVNRQAEALEQIAKLPPELKAWSMALRLRNTGDWRLLASPKAATLLEQLAYGRARLMADDANLLVDFLEATPPMAAPADVPDWARMALGVGFSVEEGHIFATSSIAKEFMDFTSAWQGMTGERPQKEALIAALNTPMTRGVIKKGSEANLAVLSTGALASFHQRHLLHAVGSTQYFFRELWGEDNEAANLEAMVRTQLASLTLYPLLMPVVACDMDATAQARTAAAEFCRKHPHLVTAEKWATLERPEKGTGGGTPPPPSNRWLTKGVVFGTAHDFHGRGCKLDCMHHMNTTERQALAALAPYDFHLLYNYATLETVSGSEEFRKVLQPVADYNVLAATTIAKQFKHDPKAYASAMEKVCLLDANEYITLAHYLAQQGLAEDAARAYESAFEKASNRVSMANNSSWLINYYFDNNRRDEALKIAKEAADVYSFRGLEAAGKLMERMENWSEAQGYYEAIKERYGSREPLVGYMLRQKDKSPEVARAYDAMIGEEFPNGMKIVTFADLTGEPASGAVITSNSDLTLQHGLKTGDVIVALDGYRVDTFGQYGFIRGMKEEAPLQLIFWNGSEYRELSAHVPARRFECGMATYEK